MGNPQEYCSLHGLAKNGFQLFGCCFPEIREVDLMMLSVSLKIMRIHKGFHLQQGFGSVSKGPTCSICTTFPSSIV